MFNPVLANYNAGSAVQTLTGGIVLSNFVTAQPNSNIDCQPIIKFYVQTGTYTPGTVMNFTSSSATAALCDATPGYSSFSVSYNPDGTWTVTPYALLRAADGQYALVAGDAALNTDILNEAGTALLSRGYAANYNPPFVVQNLTHPNLIRQFSEYQVGPTGGQMAGRICTNVGGGGATFS